MTASWSIGLFSRRRASARSPCVRRSVVLPRRQGSLMLQYQVTAMYYRSIDPCSLPEMSLPGCGRKARLAGECFPEGGGSRREDQDLRECQSPGSCRQQVHAGWGCQIALRALYNIAPTRTVSMPEPDLPLQSEEALKKMVDSILAKLSKMRNLKKDLVTNYQGDGVQRRMFRV